MLRGEDLPRRSPVRSVYITLTYNKILCNTIRHHFQMLALQQRSSQVQKCAESNQSGSQPTKNQETLEPKQLTETQSAPRSQVINVHLQAVQHTQCVRSQAVRLIHTPGQVKDSGSHRPSEPPCGQRRALQFSGCCTPSLAPLGVATCHESHTDFS